MENSVLDSPQTPAGWARVKLDSMQQLPPCELIPVDLVVCHSPVVRVPEAARLATNHFCPPLYIGNLSSQFCANRELVHGGIPELHLSFSVCELAG